MWMIWCPSLQKTELLILRLIHEGADVNCQDIDGCTPLHLAFALQVSGIVEMCLCDSNTSLCKVCGVCDSQREDVCRVLMANGADTNCTNKAGWTYVGPPPDFFIESD